MMIPSRIAIGSCNNQVLTNEFWSILEARNPAAFVFGGDAIYSDKRETDWSGWFPTSRTECATPLRLRDLYGSQRSDPSYKSLLLNGNTTLFGTYDDHDYGCNNADSTYEYRRESAQAYVDFIDAPVGSAMRHRALAGYGVYGVKLFDFGRPGGKKEVPESEAAIDPDVVHSRSHYHVYSNKTVAVFVLDVRTNKTPWKKGANAFRPDFEGDFLGERQWEWFETALGRSRAEVNVVVNGLQVHGNRFPSSNIAEGWDKFPKAQQRLYDALLQDGVNAPIIVSGDVHMTQLMRRDCVRKGRANMEPRSLVEFTTSGMTHSWGTLDSPPKADPRARASVREIVDSLTARFMMTLMHAFCPWTEIMVSNSETLENGGGEGSRTGLQYSLDKNVGELEFDWESRQVILRALGENNKEGYPPLLMASIPMDSLSGLRGIPGSRLRTSDFLSEGGNRNATLSESEWICVNHRGIDTPHAHLLGLGATALFLFLPSGFIFLLLFIVARMLLRIRRQVERSKQYQYELIPTLKPVL